MPPNNKAHLTGNQLLDRLPAGLFDSLAPSLEPVTLAAKEGVYDEGQPIRHVWFPTSAVISLVVVLEDGREIEATTVGREGLVGFHLVLGLDFSPLRALCQVPGGALRLPAGVLRRAVEASPAADAFLRRYVAVFLRNANQIVACNAVHSVEERACRWLLMAHDRVGSDEFSLTQEFLAEMLGVRRQSVTVVAGALQQAGLIAYRRGVVRILNRTGLEGASCECYRVMRAFYEGLLK
ncbi:MAG TPA: Crp/Fnr family transcriptional regulator [Gemmataceae bacterium]|nr:Crp/Fnr family transcriptional regulator [Gemmataceae bacterium]